jgi:peptide subunit release factor 1 (eRF1)
MAWEDRNGNSYYYRKRREGQRVISAYIGNGFTGQIAEVLDMEDRVEAQQARDKAKEQRKHVKFMEEQISEIEKYTKAVTRAVILISGYHPHKRQWRKRQNV